ncbi:hypothetical protein P7G51_06295 [Enterococcus asini]|uniref:hypothetical protein n=1 Tax=Enterococcus asini TaxID=57732 RepID=UPI00288E406A|nr:hypothetical protein [Enterococcus asini]MDT2756987.1 hypothetical protein [Enterococcus asini]
METIRGTVNKIKILKMTEHPLVYFKVEDTNCLISAHALSFLADVAEGTRVAISGKLNDRKQFVCRKYVIIGKSQIMIEFEQSKYPHKARC